MNQPQPIATLAARAALIAAGLVGASLLDTQAFANVGQDYGFGSRGAGLAGANGAWGFDGFAAYSNPAGLPLATAQSSLDPSKRLAISWAFIAMQPQFIPIDDVIVENDYTSDQITYGNVEMDYRTTLGQTLGLAYRLFPDGANFSFGFTAFLPFEQVAFMDTGETYVPEYFMYRARTQRPQFELAFGGDLGKGFSVGAGAHVAYGITSNANVFLQTSPDKPSTMRFSASLKPKLAPYFGVLFAPQNSSISAGGVLRMPVASTNSLTLRSAARVFGSFAAIDLQASALSALFYDPLTLELAGSWQMSRFRSYLQLEYQFWGKFESPALLIEEPQVGKCEAADPTSCTGLNISGGSNPSFNYVNILVPRVAEEIQLGGVTLRFGYAYRPSVLEGLPTDAGNYLDPAKHIVTAGAGFQFNRFLHFEVPTKLDFHLAYHHLLTQYVTKTPGTEAGTGTGEQKIGAPGYNAGGKMIGGGVSLSLVF